MRCVVDPCNNPAQQAGDGILCPAEHGCHPDAPGSALGTCMPRLSLHECEVDGSPPCPTGTYCRGFAGIQPPEWIDPEAEGWCVPWAREGARCVVAAFPDDVQCEPGTLCQGTIENPWSFRCRRPCPDGVADCPCATPELQPECIGEGSSTAYCTSCFPIGQECDEEEGAPKCCGGAICEPQSFGDISLCCTATGECETNDDCCGTNECQGGFCKPCGGIGDPPDPDGGCCRDRPTVDGICSRPCEWAGVPVMDDDECTPTAAHETCVGTIVCDPAGASCIPPDSEPDDNCDEVDNDCDGVVDDDYEDECTDTPSECTNAGFTPSFAGTRTCGGSDECVYSADSFCRLANGVTGLDENRNPPGCFYGYAGLNCADDTACSPGEACGPPGPGSCTSVGDSGCCSYRLPGASMITAVPCCRPDNTQRGVCWNPGDHRT